MAFDTSPQIVTGSAQDCGNLLGTHSPTLAMAAPVRAAMLEDTRRLIEVRFAGQVCQHCAMNQQNVQRN
ncbi:MAG TPA: hypothetical protein VLL28_13920 [Hyphomicrobiaceae bacterium]|nr:hypothetical protein [Hyphomicrobiaceae bacterium]